MSQSTAEFELSEALQQGDQVELSFINPANNSYEVIQYRISEGLGKHRLTSIPLENEGSSRQRFWESINQNVDAWIAGEEGEDQIQQLESESQEIKMQFEESVEVQEVIRTQTLVPPTDTYNAGLPNILPFIFAHPRIALIASIAGVGLASLWGGGVRPPDIQGHSINIGPIHIGSSTETPAGPTVGQSGQAGGAEPIEVKVTEEVDSFTFDGPDPYRDKTNGGYVSFTDGFVHAKMADYYRKAQGQAGLFDPNSIQQVVNYNETYASDPDAGNKYQRVINWFTSKVDQKAFIGGNKMELNTRITPDKAPNQFPIPKNNDWSKVIDPKGEYVPLPVSTPTPVSTPKPAVPQAAEAIESEAVAPVEPAPAPAPEVRQGTTPAVGPSFRAGLESYMCKDGLKNVADAIAKAQKDKCIYPQLVDHRVDINKLRGFDGRLSDLFAQYPELRQMFPLNQDLNIYVKDRGVTKTMPFQFSDSKKTNLLTDRVVNINDEVVVLTDGDGYALFLKKCGNFVFGIPQPKGAPTEIPTPAPTAPAVVAPAPERPAPTAAAPAPTIRPTPGIQIPYGPPSSEIVPLPAAVQPSPEFVPPTPPPEFVNRALIFKRVVDGNLVFTDPRDCNQTFVFEIKYVDPILGTREEVRGSCGWIQGISQLRVGTPYFVKELFSGGFEVTDIDGFGVIGSPDFANFTNRRLILEERDICIDGINNQRVRVQDIGALAATRGYRGINDINAMIDFLFQSCRITPTPSPSPSPSPSVFPSASPTSSTTPATPPTTAPSPSSAPSRTPEPTRPATVTPVDTPRPQPPIPTPTALPREQATPIPQNTVLVPTVGVGATATPRVRSEAPTKTPLPVRGEMVVVDI